nr:MAG TPA: Chitinase A [Caudoviricetes sp.]
MSALADAVQTAVECQGAAWGARNRIGNPDEIGNQLALAIAAAPDMADRRTVAAIIGESAQETDWMCSLTEYGGPSARYAPYFGRGCIQLTWRNNYAGFGQWLHGLGVVADSGVFVNNPDLVTVWPYPWLSAIYYFVRHISQGYVQAENWNAVSGLINAGDPNYYVPSYELRSRSVRAALDALSDWSGVEYDMQLSDVVTRYDGHQASLNDILGYLDGRVERLASQVDDLMSLVKGGGIAKRGQGDDAGGTDLCIEVGWLPQNFAELRELIGRLARQEDVTALLDEIRQAHETDDASQAKASAPQEHLRYVVQKGDTLAEVARYYGRTVEQLLKVNPQAGDGNSMRAGDILDIPQEGQA